MTPPGAPRQLVILFPIAFVPGRHFMLDRKTVNPFCDTFSSTFWMRVRRIRFTSLLPPIPSLRNSTDGFRPIHILHKPTCNGFSLPAVSNTLRDEMFRETHRRKPSGARLHHRLQYLCVPAAEPLRRLLAAGYYIDSLPLTSTISRSQYQGRGQQFSTGDPSLGLDELNRQR